MRFHNYQAQFTVLDIGRVSRTWLTDVLACDALSATPTDLEKFAAHLWQMADGNVGTYEVTGATADGGDACGEYHIGPPADRIRVTFTSKPSCTPRRRPLRCIRAGSPRSAG
jgi:hypothetical protein